MLGADDDAVGPDGASRATASSAEDAGRGRVLDVAAELLREADELREPVERELLELLERG